MKSNYPDFLQGSKTCKPTPLNLTNPYLKCKKRLFISLSKKANMLIFQSVELLHLVFWFVISGTAQVLLIILTMALFYSSVPMTHSSVTMSQHAQYPETKEAKWNKAIIICMILHLWHVQCPQWKSLSMMKIIVSFNPSEDKNGPIKWTFSFTAKTFTSPVCQHWLITFPFLSVCRDRKNPERRGEGRGEVHRRCHQQEHETGPESFNTSQAVS